MPSCARILLGLCLSAGFLSAGCSSSSKIAQENLGFEISDKAASVSKLWTRTMPGLVTDVSLNSDGSKALLTLVPDTEGALKNPPAVKIKDPTLAVVGSEGEITWSKVLDSKPKWQAFSAGGDFSVATTYDGKLVAFDASGKLLWDRDNYCRPRILEKSSHILCHRWDDAKPTGMGFDLYDRAGTKLQSFPVTGELLDLSVSADEKFVALSLTGGRVQVIDLESLKLAWEVKVRGQMIGVSISSGPEPLLAVFFYKRSDTGKHQATLALYNSGSSGGGSGGKLVDQLMPEGQFEQVAISPNAQIIAVYGNSSRGQLLVSFSRAAVTPPAADFIKFKEAWRHQSPRYSDYNSPLVVTDQRIIVGFEDGTSADSGKSVTHLFSFDRGGKVEWAIPLVSDEGGYLFAYSREGSEPILFGVADNGEVSAYRIKSGD